MHQVFGVNECVAAAGRLRAATRAPGRAAGTRHELARTHAERRAASRPSTCAVVDRDARVPWLRRKSDARGRCVLCRARPANSSMSAFAALTGFEGDDDIVAEHKKKIAQEEKQREAAVEAAQRAFQDFKAKAGQSNWADDDDEEDDFYGGVRRCHRISAWLRACASAPHSPVPPAAWRRAHPARPPHGAHFAIYMTSPRTHLSPHLAHRRRLCRVERVASHAARPRDVSALVLAARALSEGGARWRFGHALRPNCMALACASPPAALMCPCRVDRRGCRPCRPA